MIKVIALFLFSLLVQNMNAKELSGLILSGIDTLFTKNQLGFDFVMQTNCTTFVNVAPFPCVDHFRLWINSYTLKYVLDIPSGSSIKMGKINLDSIKSAQPDSIFAKQPDSQGDSISVDSLSSRIGNVYLIKTAIDPRSVYNVPLYAKMKILKFIVVDSSLHQIKMVFLWAYNDDGLKDLTTSGLDTFHLETPTINQPKYLTTNGGCRNISGSYVFKVVGDRFVLPKELVGKVKSVTVWDLRGRRLETIKYSMVINQITFSNRVKLLSKGIIIVVAKEYSL